ncbi:hypothetical protein BC939DRAFT_529580 [Gamsiella multidivaricata]|uniref:uncharacterized protein n=1 Tax=Gamsiella multidivaricata TaxID=101098 RepID=UPI00221F6658|nr:uncharacterized protein BC939DRAFT_529580 [Gamsiella multidivaricata]KAG0368967.1 hypothetical protein BGZ54_000714 [Gamsiella multidivaricata]KAI7822386.1 hypothetical protein BC939DRAFT_529580 [Gamsiella multidivaricata]
MLSTVPSDPSVQEHSLLQITATESLVTRSTKSITDMSTTWEPLQELGLPGLRFQPEDWKTLIETLELDLLETLGFRRSNFSADALKILVERVTEDGSEVPLRHLDFTDSDLSRCAISEAHSLCAALKRWRRLWRSKD